MNIIAFEVSLNGKRQYTVGAEEWQHIWAHVLAHRIDPNVFPTDPESESSEVAKEQFILVHLRASVSVPGKDEMQSQTQSERQYSTSRTGSYPEFNLEPGDVVEIKVVETDSVDDPQWQERDPRFPGPTIMPSNPERD